MIIRASGQVQAGASDKLEKVSPRGLEKCENRAASHFGWRAAELCPDFLGLIFFSSRYSIKDVIHTAAHGGASMKLKSPSLGK